MINIIARLTGVALLLLTSSAHAIFTSDGGGRAPRGNVAPLDLHRALERKDFRAYQPGYGRGFAFTPPPATPAADYGAPRARPALVLNSLRITTKIETSDVFRQSRAQMPEFIARKFLRGPSLRLPSLHVVDFDPKRTVVFEPGVENYHVKGFSYFPDQPYVSYSGPVGFQILSRSVVNAAVLADSPSEVISRVIPYVGLQISWWSPGPQMIEGKTKPLATIASGQVAVRSAAGASTLAFDLEPADHARAVEFIRALLDDERAYATAQDRPFDLDRADIRIAVHLLNDEAKTITEYPLDPALTSSLVDEAREHRSVLRDCGRWLGDALMSRPSF